MIGLVKMRELEIDENFSLRGKTLQQAMDEDRKNGLIPFFVSTYSILCKLSIYSFLCKYL